MGLGRNSAVVDLNYNRDLNICEPLHELKETCLIDMQADEFKKLMHPFTTKSNKEILVVLEKETKEELPSILEIERQEEEENKDKKEEIPKETRCELNIRSRIVESPGNDTCDYEGFFCTLILFFINLFVYGVIGYGIFKIFIYIMS